MNKELNTTPASPQSETEPISTDTTDTSTTAPLEEKPVAGSATPISDAALDRLIAEAEERGYLRGRNEKISIAMEQWETSTDLAPDLLLTPRKSMWD